MKKFVLLYYMAGAAMSKIQNSSQDEMKAEEQRWMDWFKSMGDNLVDMGEYFVAGVSLDPQGYTDTQGPVAGYSIVQADSMASAKKMVESHPHAVWSEGCSIELYETKES